MNFNSYTILAWILFGLQSIFAQAVPQPVAGETTALFLERTPLELKLRFSQRELLTETNDSTYLNSMLLFRQDGEQWDSLPVRVRARGNFRRENCFLAPIKLRLKKKDTKGTLFEGNKELKLVLPCFESERGADYVLKEYIAYRMYEHVTPFHFKTRPFQMEYADARRNKDRVYHLQGFMIEDIDRVAERVGGHKLKRSVHPLQQDNICSVQNDFFQFMIANTDFSVAYQHNEKLVFVDGRKAIPVPYDFDMSGFVNTSYAVVSEIQNEKLDIEKVTQRLYRGFRRNPEVYDQVRQDYLAKKDRMLGELDAHAGHFNGKKQHQECREFLKAFFEILEDSSLFREQILAVARDN
ncbi:hypothetical protein OZ410_02970 [Robiginitalea sp. M366]|uniref:hypothetical protein n=1 Tax=Robiginitalea aestuariiviva TaxID=3036903 RepID=UPI00240D4F6F|nr:hypothetical protein [Robiginitalea aestuariiviva]MDG1571260.1 hypothetical protein [Robiginitalea aestuariiviva]